MEKLVSWDAVSARLEVAMARATEREIEEARKRKEEEEGNFTDKEPAEIFIDGVAHDSETD